VVEHGNHVDGFARVQRVHATVLGWVQRIHEGLGSAVAAPLVVQTPRAHELVACANHRRGLHVSQLELEVQNVTGQAVQALTCTPRKRAR